jgi:hypothetical protein
MSNNNPFIARAMVLEDADNWYADDGALSRQLCELVEPEKGKKGEAEEECCACDEAKYQVCDLVQEVS